MAARPHTLGAQVAGGCLAHVVVLGWGTAAACLAMAGQFVVRVHWFGWSGPRHHCRELPGPSVRNLQEKRAEGQHRARRQRALTYGVRTRTGHCCVPALPFGAQKDAESCFGSVARGQTPLQPRGLRAPCDVWAAQALLLLTQHPALRYTRRRQLWEQKVLLAQTHGEREGWEGTEEDRKGLRWRRSSPEQKTKQRR